MTYSYFPGCTLKTKAKELDRYARISAEALGFTLEEIPDWQCCGGVYPMATNEIATKLSSIRALASAKAKGQSLVTLCSACHNVIKQVNNQVATDDFMAMKANNYLKLEEPYQGETKVLHYLEVLRDEIGFVPQKGVLFSGTIASNLRFGKDDASDEEIAKAAEIAQATEFIEAKDDKYETPIAQGGSNVSGGQKQRLAIARAILADNKILILVMKDGDIIEQGNHEELLAANGFYANLYNSQFEDVVA